MAGLWTLFWSSAVLSYELSVVCVTTALIGKQVTILFSFFFFFFFTTTYARAETSEYSERFLS